MIFLIAQGGGFPRFDEVILHAEDVALEGHSSRGAPSHRRWMHHEYLRAGEHVFRHQRELQLGDPPKLIRPRSIFSGPMHHAHSLQFGAPLAGRCLSDPKPGVPMPHSSDTAPRSQPMNSKMKRRPAVVSVVTGGIHGIL